MQAESEVRSRERATPGEEMTRKESTVKGTNRVDTGEGIAEVSGHKGMEVEEQVNASSDRTWDSSASKERQGLNPLGSTSKEGAKSVRKVSLIDLYSLADSQRAISSRRKVITKCLFTATSFPVFRYFSGVALQWPALRQATTTMPSVLNWL